MSLASRRSAASRVLVAAVLPVLMLVSTVLASSPAEAQKVRPDFFGIHDADLSSGSLPGVTVGAVRLWDTPGTTWRQIETIPGVFDFGKLDTAVNTARAAGLRPMIVLGQTPQFHATDPTAPGAYGPGATSMPDVSAWQQYVARVATRYKNTVDYQIWNEPNVVNYWTGTVGQMATLTVTGSRVIRQKAGSNATVVAPSFPLRLASQQKWFGAYWHAKASGASVSSQVDVVSVSLYPLATQGPEASMKLLAVAKHALPTEARRKPIWNAEINYGLLGGPPAKEIPAARQAAYVVRTLVLNAASSIKRVYWYRWIVGPVANTHLVENDATTLTRAGKAWGVARGWLVGTKVAGCHQASTGQLKGVYTCTARKGRLEVRRIYWKPTGKAATVATDKTTTRWSDLDGHTTRHQGRLKLKVGKLPVMVASRR